MQKWFILLTIFLWPCSLDAHPLHLSVTNITYGKGLLKVTIKTFRDDWETAYFHFTGKTIDLSTRERETDEWIRTYLSDHFRLATSEEGSTVDLQVGEILTEGDAMKISARANAPPDLKTLYLYNSLLTDIFPDQTNLVIFGFKKMETGIKFDVQKHTAEVKLE